MMIKNYVFLDAEGIYPIGAGAHFTVPDGATEVSWDAFTYADYAFIEGAWIARPKIADPAITGDGIVTFLGLPEGTLITITDRDTRAVLAVTSETTFQLSESAEYDIEVAPPLPWMPWSGVISC